MKYSGCPERLWIFAALFLIGFGHPPGACAGTQLEKDVDALAQQYSSLTDTLYSGSVVNAKDEDYKKLLDLRAKIHALYNGTGKAEKKMSLIISPSWET